MTGTYTVCPKSINNSSASLFPKRNFKCTSVGLETEVVERGMVAKLRWGLFTNCKLRDSARAVLPTSFCPTIVLKPGVSSMSFADSKLL